MASERHLNIPVKLPGCLSILGWITLDDNSTMTTATARQYVTVTPGLTSDNFTLWYLVTSHPRVMSRRMVNLELREGDREDERIGGPPADGLLTQSILVSESRHRQIIFLHLDFPRVWRLRNFFLLINELANDWLISGLPRSDEKTGP
jgi:hypothetical protein